MMVGLWWSLIYRRVYRILLIQPGPGNKSHYYQEPSADDFLDLDLNRGGKHGFELQSG